MSDAAERTATAGGEVFRPARSRYRPPQVPDMRRRRLSAPLRALPDFLVIGAMKAGTSSFYYHLTRHPQVLQAARKEVHYFDGRAAHLPLSEYRCFFPLAAKLRMRRAITGEATPSYLFKPEAPTRIRAALGSEIRLIVLLRDPVERAISHYGNLVRWAGETRPIEAYLEHVPRIDEGYVLEADDPCGWRLRPDGNDIVARGIYDVQIRRYLETFDAARLHVILFEDFVADPQREMSRAFAFLGLPDAPMNTRKRLNSGARAQIDERTRRGLAERFVPANARLEALLGRTLPW